MPTLHLVRHGRPAVDRRRAASTWDLHEQAYAEVLAWPHPLPTGARWFTSPEPKARRTAALLHPGEVGVVAGLGEQRRPAGWVPGFDGVVERAFARPDLPAAPGWEPLAACRDRVVGAVTSLLSACSVSDPGRDLVLVGHGTAWTVLTAALTGRPVDVDAWHRLAMPDLVASIDLATVAG